MGHLPLSILRGFRYVSASLQPMPNTGLRGLNRGDRDAIELEDTDLCDKADVDVVAVDTLIDDNVLMGEPWTFNDERFWIPMPFK